MFQQRAFGTFLGLYKQSTYCPTKQEFIDSGFSKSGYDLSIDNIIAINQLIPKTALTETASVIKFDINPISLYPCSDWCILDYEGNEVTPSASTYGIITFSGVSSVISDLVNGVAASIELCTDKNDIYGTLIDDFEWSFYSADTFTVDGEEWVMGYIESVLPQNKTNENKTYYLVLNYQYNAPDDQSIFEIVQSKYWEPPYWDIDSSGNFPHSVPKTGGTYSVSIKDPYNIGWIIEENDDYNISEQRGKGNVSINVKIPKATSVGAQYGSIYGYRPQIDINDNAFEGYLTIYTESSTAKCAGDADDCINIYQYGLDKPSWNYSASTLPYSKQYESGYSSSNYSWLYYYIRITNKDNIKWKCEMPYWLTLRDSAYASNLITSGSIKIYSGATSESSFAPKLTESAYQDKTHYDGTIKFYYQDNGSSTWNLIDSKSITKCARPYIETPLNVANGNIPWGGSHDLITIHDDDSCGYSYAISGDSNYSAWTTDTSQNVTFTGDTEIDVSVPENLTNNDIEGYIILKNKFSNSNIDTVPFRQECKKMKVYFTGQNFTDGYAQDGATYLYAIDDVMTTQGFAYLGKGFDGNDVQNSYIEMYKPNIVDLQNAIDEWGNNFNIVAYTKLLTLNDFNDNSVYQDFVNDSSQMAEEVEYTVLEELLDAWNNNESNVTINTAPTPSITPASWNLTPNKAIDSDGGSFSAKVTDTKYQGYKLDWSSWLSSSSISKNNKYTGGRTITFTYSENTDTNSKTGFIKLMTSAGTVISQCIITQSGASKAFSYTIDGATRQTGNYYVLDDWKRGTTVLINIVSNTSWTINYEGKGWSANIASGGGTYSGNKTLSFYLNDSAVTANDWEQLNIELVCDGSAVHDFITLGA